MAIKHITDATFDAEVLQNPKLVLVDFWAEWCGPCRAVAPVLEEIAVELRDQLEIVKVNSDENPTVVGRYGITSIPTLHLFREGQVVKTIVGAQPKPRLLKQIQELL